LKLTGKENTRIQELLDRFLVDQPFAAEMTPEKSLYDLAARVFAVDQVMLREHFRCVPPIISYSNRTFYQNQILPLSIPRSSERIEPPLVDICFESGVGYGFGSFRQGFACQPSVSLRKAYGPQY
jgi:hypothetical protein